MTSAAERTLVTETRMSETVLMGLRGITKEFPGVKALDDVNLEVCAGEVHGVVGENGAGKSTLMAVASGALTPESGNVILNDAQQNDLTPQRARDAGIAIVRQEPALLPDLTVAENIYLGVTAARRPPALRMVAWAQNQLEAWGSRLDFDAKSRVDTLSPQQRFIVEFCKALAQKPKTLILDEPTEHLLSDEVELLFEHVRSHVAAGGAVVYISHRIPEVRQIAHRLTVLRNGRTVATRDIDDVSEDDIVTLIIGRNLDVFFPPKASISDEGRSLRLENYSTLSTEPVNLDFKAGKIIGLAGIEGSGQRELMRALAGLEPASGRVTFNDGGRLKGADVEFLSGDRHNEGILTSLGVKENIILRSLKRLFPLGLVSSSQERRVAARAAAEFRVKTPALDTPIDSLSGGNQQKALLAGVLLNSPRLILVDEPTQGVDVGARSEIYGVLRKAAEEGAIVVMLSSDTLELAGVADEVFIFSRGQLVKHLRGSEVSDEAITNAELNVETQRNRTAPRAGHEKRLLTWFAADRAPLVVVSIFILLLTSVVAFGNPQFFNPFNVYGVLTLSATLALVACGQMLVMLTAGIDLSTGPLVGFTVIVASFFMSQDSSLAAHGIGWLLIPLTGLLIGLVNWALIDVVKLSPIVATLSTYMAIQGVAFILRPIPGGAISSEVLDSLAVAVGPIPVTFIAVVVLAALMTYALLYTRIGVMIRAVGSDEAAARVNGISPRLIRLFAYLGCSLLTSIAGIAFMGQVGTGDPRAGITFTLISISAAVVGGASVFGGRGLFIGAVLGAVLVQIVNASTVFLKLSPDWQYYLVAGMTLASVAIYSVARRRAAHGS